MDNKRSNQAQGGKRALLILVSALLLLIVAVAAWLGRDDSDGDRRKMEKEPARKQVAQVALSVMQADLSALTAAEDGNGGARFVGRDEVIDGAPADRMEFPCWTLYQSAPGEIRRQVATVEYRLKTDPGVPGHYLMRSETYRADAGVQKRGNTVSLAGQVKSLNMTYTDADGRTVDRWNDSAGPPAHPAQVEVRLILIGKDGQMENYVAVLKTEKFSSEQ